nr:hypothetical protein [Micromonospora sp. DSM 115978]
MTDRGQADDLTESELESLQARLELINIQLTRLSGEWVTDSEENCVVDEISAEIRGQYRFVHDALIQFRWSADLPIREANGRDIASLGVALVESFQVQPGPRPSPRALSAFMREAALSIAMPHIREALQGVSQRLGIGPLVYGLMQNAGDGSQAALPAQPGQ